MSLHTGLNTDPDAMAWYRGIASGERPWESSPLPGVERLLLDCDGDELAVTTSLVRSTDSRVLGEEYLVLDGVFEDEHGRYPAGTYVRNPASKSCGPFTDPGCVLWVKLGQCHPDDREQKTLTPDLTPLTEGQDRQALHTFTAPEATVLRERVAVLRGAVGERLVCPADYNLQEIFVVAGSVSWQWTETVDLGRWGWLRLAPGEPLRLTVKEAAVLLFKTRPKYASAG